MSVWLLVYLFFVHFVADFVLQTDWMAKGKSKEFYPLICHVGTYILAFIFGTIILGSVLNAMVFSLLNGFIHLIVDYITSRVNSALWASGNHHNFFVGIGVDQYIHAVTIILTSQLL